MASHSCRSAGCVTAADRASLVDGIEREVRVRCGRVALRSARPLVHMGARQPAQVSELANGYPRQCVTGCRPLLLRPGAAADLEKTVAPHYGPDGFVSCRVWID